MVTFNLTALAQRARDLWRRLRGWRRIHFTRAGLVFTIGTVAVGLAAINTGNNLLFLLLGAMLGFIAVSGWTSERVLRRLHVRRRVPRGVTVGRPVRITYEVHNQKRRIPTFAVEIYEEGLPGAAFISHLEAGRSTSVRSENSFIRRGVYPLDVMTLSTSFPFGLFRKERDAHLPGELVIWPRSDRTGRVVSRGGGPARRVGTALVGAAGARGEYRGLREYRVGDDPRDIHWKTTARLGKPVVKEYERDTSDTLWICVDTRGEPDEAAEVVIEKAASLAARAMQRGRRFALVTGEGMIDPGTGAAQLELVLDQLARVDFSPHQRQPLPPVDPIQCVLVTKSGSSGLGFGDRMVVSGEGR